MKHLFLTLIFCAGFYGTWQALSVSHKAFVKSFLRKHGVRFAALAITLFLLFILAVQGNGFQIF